MTEPTTRESQGSPAVPGGDSTTRFSILGAVRAARGARELPVGGPQQQLVLALLLAQAGQVITSDELVEAIWHGAPPPRASFVLHRHIAHISRLFQPGPPFRREGPHLHRRTDGYQVLVGDGDLDLLRFRRHAREASRSTNERAAVRTYLQALQLWRGQAAAGVPGIGENPVIAVLEAERVAVLIEAAACALRVRQAPRLLPFLAPAVRQHPFDERLHAQYLLCLAEGGRRAEAVHEWRQLHRRLQDALGVQPNEELMAVRERLLEPPAASAAPARLRVVPNQPVAPAAGRGTSESSGRTAVAIRVALTHDDGRLHITLRGISPLRDAARTRQVLAEFLSSWGVPASDAAIRVIPSRGPYRSVLVQRRTVLPVGPQARLATRRPLPSPSVRSARGAIS